MMLAWQPVLNNEVQPSVVDNVLRLCQLTVIGRAVADVIPDGGKLKPLTDNRSNRKELFQNTFCTRNRKHP